jgi:serine/threonine protein kinase
MREQVNEPAAPVYQPGTVLAGRYELLQRLGHGRLGEVWKGQDNRLGLTVAIRVLYPDVDAEIVAEDATQLMSLTHPNVLRVYDVVRSPEGNAVIQEFASGRTLDRLLRERPAPFEVPEIQEWAVQLIGALQFGMEHTSISHGDIRLDNLYINSDNRLKIADFGFSYLKDQLPPVDEAGASSDRSLSYLSPQRLAGEEPSLADDIYAAGACLYELLTGKPVFEGGNVVSQISFKVPPGIAERRKELGLPPGKIPKNWEAFIAKCLSKQAFERPTTRADLSLLTDARTEKHKTEVSPIAAAKPFKAPRVPVGNFSKLLVPLLAGGAVLVLIPILVFALVIGPRDQKIRERTEEAAVLDEEDGAPEVNARERLDAWDEFQQRYAIQPVGFTKRDEELLVHAGQRKKHWQQELDRLAREKEDAEKAAAELTSRLRRALIAVKQSESATAAPSERVTAWTAIEQEYGKEGHPTSESYQALLNEVALTRAGWVQKEKDQRQAQDQARQVAESEVKKVMDQQNEWASAREQSWTTLQTYVKDPVATPVSKVSRIEAFLEELKNSPAGTTDAVARYTQQAEALRTEILAAADGQAPASPLPIADLVANAHIAGESASVQRALVILAQEKLDVTTDGDHGTRSHNALLDYQRSHKLVPTAQLDLPTLKSMGLDTLSADQITEQAKDLNKSSGSSGSSRRYKKKAAEPEEEPGFWSKVGGIFKKDKDEKSKTKSSSEKRK